jgi:phosphomevalonate kinase
VSTSTESENAALSTRAKAPGKVVIAGAYAVLEGAVALVCAVDRYVVADAARPASLLTAEVAQAVRNGALQHAPHFDSSALRSNGRKLGLGSSAAILVASLAAANATERALAERTAYLADELDAPARDALFHTALLAHRQAQGGGSGIDVAASVFGGTLVYQLQAPGEPTLRATSLPRGLCAEVWSSPSEASTAEFLQRVREAQHADPTRYSELMAELSASSAAAVNACDQDDLTAFLAAQLLQQRNLARLGQFANIPICTREVQALHEAAEREGAVVLPAGAGGGDVSLFVGRTAPSDALCTLRAKLAQENLHLCLGARGVHLG